MINATATIQRLTVIISAGSGNGGTPSTPAQRYTHTQASPSTSWTIDYPDGMTGYPSIVITDEQGRTMWANIRYTFNTQCIIDFGKPKTGFAYLKF